MPGVSSSNDQLIAGQMLRNGMNPALRGYSPSKPYWKQGPVGKSVGNQQKTTYSGALSVPGPHGSGSASTFGGSNPNVYTRSTKHTPSSK